MRGRVPFSLIRGSDQRRRVIYPRPKPGRTPLLLILLFAGIVAVLFLTREAKIEPPLHRAVQGPPTTPQSVAPPEVPSIPGPTGTRYEVPERMLAMGQLREAQDEYLKLLLASPNDPRAMQGLVAVQRRTVHDNPEALRQRAERYRRAASGSVETAEHYSAESMNLLSIANLMAAAQVDAERLPRTAARASGSSERRIERAPVGAAAVPRTQRTIPAAGAAQATLGQRPGGPRPAPAQAVPQVQPYHAPAVVRPSAIPSVVPPLRPAVAPPAAPGGLNPPVQTVALVRPLPERTVGLLRTVNCGAATLGVHGASGTRTFVASSRTIIYAGTEKLTQFCGLKRFLGSRVIVWGIGVGARHTAERISVSVLSASNAGAPRGRQGGREVSTRLPVLNDTRVSWNATGDPSGGGTYAEVLERDGIVTTKISNAALVVSRDGAHPVVITTDTKVVGLRSAFGAIGRFDHVRVRGQNTASGTLIADVIEVTLIPDGRQLQQLGVSAGYASANGMAGLTAVGALGGQSLGGRGEVGVSGGASVGGGASVSGGASVNGRGASVSGGASASAGGASVSGGASASAGGGSGSGSANASVDVGKGSASAGGSASTSAGRGSGSASANASVDVGKGSAGAGGGASASAGRGSGSASANASVDVGKGSASAGGGASASAGGGSGSASANASVDVGKGSASAGGGASASAGGASASGGGSASVGGGSGSAGGGASANAGKGAAGASGSASVDAGKGSSSAGGNASASAGGASASGGGSASAGGGSGSAGGGASANAGKGSAGASGGASVNAGGKSVSGGASIGVGGGSGGGGGVSIDAGAAAKGRQE